jgi:hypothetical protein
MSYTDIDCIIHDATLQPLGEDNKRKKEILIYDESLDYGKTVKKTKRGKKHELISIYNHRKFLMHGTRTSKSSRTSNQTLHTTW